MQFKDLFSTLTIHDAVQELHLTSKLVRRKGMEEGNILKKISAFLRMYKKFNEAIRKKMLLTISSAGCTK